MSRPPRTRPASTSPLGRPTLTPSVEPLTVGAPPSLAADLQSPVVPEYQNQVLPDSDTPEIRDSVVLGLRKSDVEPRWQQFVRKEARLRGDQLSQLAGVRRRLSKARGRRDETITDNTLIRIAVDLLMQRADDLHGDTERDLRRSIGLTD